MVTHRRILDIGQGSRLTRKIVNSVADGDTVAITALTAEYLMASASVISNLMLVISDNEFLIVISDSRTSPPVTVSGHPLLTPERACILADVSLSTRMTI